MPIEARFFYDLKFSSETEFKKYLKTADLSKVMALCCSNFQPSIEDLKLFPNLSNLAISGISLNNNYLKSIFNNLSLKILDLSGSENFFELDFEIFKKCFIPELRIRNICSNKELSLSTMELFEKLLQNYPSLKVLDIQNQQSGNCTQFLLNIIENSIKNCETKLDTIYCNMNDSYKRYLNILLEANKYDLIKKSGLFGDLKKHSSKSNYDEKFDKMLSIILEHYKKTKVILSVNEVKAKLSKSKYKQKQHDIKVAEQEKQRLAKERKVFIVDKQNNVTNIKQKHLNSLIKKFKTEYNYDVDVNIVANYINKVVKSFIKNTKPLYVEDVLHEVFIRLRQQYYSLQYKLKNKDNVESQKKEKPLSFSQILKLDAKTLRTKSLVDLIALEKTINSLIKSTLASMTELFQEEKPNRDLDYFIEKLDVLNKKLKCIYKIKKERSK